MRPEELTIRIPLIHLVAVNRVTSPAPGCYSIFCWMGNVIKRDRSDTEVSTLALPWQTIPRESSPWGKLTFSTSLHPCSGMIWANETEQRIYTEVTSKQYPLSLDRLFQPAGSRKIRDLITSFLRGSSSGRRDLGRIRLFIRVGCESAGYGSS